MKKYIWKRREIIFRLYKKYHLKVIFTVKYALYVLIASTLDNIKFYKLIRNESDKFLVKNIFLFWIITLISCLLSSEVTQMFFYLFVSDSAGRFLMESFVMFAGGILFNVFVFQLIHGWSKLWPRRFDFVLWIKGTSEANEHIMNIVSMLAIVAALITKNYADMLNYLLLSIAFITIICSISIELYEGFVMAEWEEKLYCFMSNCSYSEWRTTSNIKQSDVIVNLPVRIRHDLVTLAKKYKLKKIVLFGSRARGDNHAKSDVDIAVYGCQDFTNFYFDVESSVWTLLTFDIINMDGAISSELQREIQRDGVVIYEKV